MGRWVAPIGGVYDVKVLGAFCIADQGEMDWKVLALNSREADEMRVKTLEDFRRLVPGRVEDIMRWFRIYKTFEGKKENALLFDAKVFDIEETMEMIKGQHKAYENLVRSGGKIRKKAPWLGQQ